jgi:hypothetical protein
MKRFLGKIGQKGRQQMPGSSRKLPDAALRLLVVVVILVGAIAVVYIKVLPILLPSFADTEVQIASVIATELSRSPKYAGAQICGDCHEEQHTVQKHGYHRNISCETCHGPGQGHVDNVVDVKPPAPRARAFCPTCHAYNASRPMGFPQINPVTHNPLEPCISCHQAHDPKPPTIPSQCVACHAEVERTKAVSPHVLLECTTCHVTPEEHKVTPWSVKPTKPVDREFCGTCHGIESDVERSPKIDLSTHEEKYLCWQCHYPHMPEVES